jgi:hypothetical protein
MCVPSLVEIAPGVRELCPDTHTHTSIFIGIDRLTRRDISRDRTRTAVIGKANEDEKLILI